MIKRVFLKLAIFISFAQEVYAQEGLRDIRPPVALPLDFGIFGDIMLFLTILGFVAFAVYLIKKIKLKKKAAPIVVRLPSEIAYEKLEELRKRNLPEQDKKKEYYTILADIVRNYIEGRFSVSAPEMTTPEFLNQIKRFSELKLTQKDLLAEFLNCCDMVKFAKYGPTNKEIEDSFTSAKRFVDDTKKVIAEEKVKSNVI